MAYKTKKKKVAGTDITNTTTQHQDGKIRHTRSTKFGNTTTSVSRNTNGSMRVTKTTRLPGGYTRRTQKTYGTKVNFGGRKKSSGGSLTAWFIGLPLLFGLIWLYSTFPVFTGYLLVIVGVLILVWILFTALWIIWTLRYLIYWSCAIFIAFYIYNKYL